MCSDLTPHHVPRAQFFVFKSIVTTNDGYPETRLGQSVKPGVKGVNTVGYRDSGENSRKTKKMVTHGYRGETCVRLTVDLLWV